MSKERRDNYKELVSAARTLGMSRRAILVNIIWPQIRGKILAGIVIAAALAAGIVAGAYVAVRYY